MHQRLCNCRVADLNKLNPEIHSPVPISYLTYLCQNELKSNIAIILHPYLVTCLRTRGPTEVSGTRIYELSSVKLIDLWTLEMLIWDTTSRTFNFNASRPNLMSGIIFTCLIQFISYLYEVSCLIRRFPSCVLSLLAMRKCNFIKWFLPFACHVPNRSY